MARRARFEGSIKVWGSRFRRSGIWACVFRLQGPLACGSSCKGSVSKPIAVSYRPVAVLSRPMAVVTSQGSM